MLSHFTIKNVLSDSQIDYLDRMENKCGNWKAKNYKEGFIDKNYLNEYGGNNVTTLEKLPATFLHDTYEKYLSEALLQEIYNIVAPHTEKQTGRLYPTIGTINTCLKPMEPHVDIVPAHRDHDKGPMYSILIPLPSTANSTTLVWNAYGKAPIKNEGDWGEPTAYEHDIGSIICFKRQSIHASGPIEKGFKRFIIMLTRSIY